MNIVRRIRDVVREPLLHFFLLGAGMFWLYGWLDDTGALSTRTVVVDSGRVEQLAAGFASLHQRRPTAVEMRALVDDAVKEEIFYREALAQGLDRDDTIVRRRMRQKLEFVSEDVAPVREPTDLQLQSWLDAHSGQFRLEPRYSFEQVFLDPSRHGESLETDAVRLRERLHGGGVTDPSSLGDPLLLPHSFDGVSTADLRAMFGGRFATALETLAPGTWQGPIRSGYGVHLVRLVQREAGREPDLDEVREHVRRDWMHAQREAANARFYAALRGRYDVRISLPLPVGTPPGAIAELRP